MGTQDSKEHKDAQLAQAIQGLAAKHGCKVRIDFEKHTIDFDCPDKQSEIDVAMEVKLMMGEEPDA